MKINDILNESKIQENLKLKKNDLNNYEPHNDNNMLEEFEIKNKIRKVCLGIPTKDLDVKNILRLLNEPITLFGEDSYDKRKRLKSVLITKYRNLIIKKKEENEQEIEEFQNILKTYYIDFSNLYDLNFTEFNKINDFDDINKNKIIRDIKTNEKESSLKEKFYTESTKELKQSRIDITLKTLPRIFLYKEMIHKFQTKYSREHYENYITSYNEHMKNNLDLYISQLGDDLPLTMGKFSPDNSVFAVSSYNTYINLFNYENDNYNLIKTLKNGHNDKINCIEWNFPNNYSYYSTLNYNDISKKDLLLASCSSDKTFSIWKPFKDYEKCALSDKAHDQGEQINGVTIRADESYDEKRPVTCKEAHLFSKEEKGCENVNGKGDDDSDHLLCNVKAHEDRINKICFHPLNKYVLTCSEDETIKFFDIETKKELFYQEGHNANVYTAVFNTYGNLYLSGDANGGLMLWDIRTGRNIERKIIHNKCIMNISFNPFFPNMFCTCSSDNTIKIFDLRKFSTTCNILAHNKIVTDVVFEPMYGRYITSSSFDTFIKIWDTINFYCTKILHNNDNKIRNVDISPDANFISSTSFDRTWKLYKNSEFTHEIDLDFF